VGREDCDGGLKRRELRTVVNWRVKEKGVENCCESTSGQNTARNAMLEAEGSPGYLLMKTLSLA
jgi:hypothetical protein